MDVNEHERLSNITLKAYNIKVNEQCFYYSSTLYTHSSMHAIILIYPSMKEGYHRGCHAGIFFVFSFMLHWNVNVTTGALQVCLFYVLYLVLCCVLVLCLIWHIGLQITSLSMTEWVHIVIEINKIPKITAFTLLNLKIFFYKMYGR